MIHDRGRIHRCGRLERGEHGAFERGAVFGGGLNRARHNIRGFRRVE